jgi:hypothetical protein
MTALCRRLTAWCELYPDPPADAERNAAAGAGEDEWFGRFAGLEALGRDQVIELINRGPMTANGIYQMIAAVAVSLV